MSIWKESTSPLLLEESVRIAFDFLERSGEVDDPMETGRFLVDRIQFMLSQGQRNRLLLANRAIAAFRKYRRARCIDLSLFAG